MKGPPYTVGSSSHQGFFQLHNLSRRRFENTHGVLEILPLRQQMIVIGMRANPKPVDPISFSQPQNSPTTPNTHSVKRFAAMHPFKTQTRVIGILSPELICLSRLASDVSGQSSVRNEKVIRQIGLHRASGSIARTRPARISSRTLAANLAS